MGRIRLRRAPAGGSGTTINPTNLPAFKGEGEGAGGTDYTCAGCDVVLAANVIRGSIRNVAVKCPKCGVISLFA